MSKLDPHKGWLDELRRRNVRLSDGISDNQPGTVPRLREEITDLRDQIIDTTPTGKAGVLTQIDLLKDMAWADPVRRLACSISKGIETLWPE